ncbi:alpha/beta hydrolase [Microbacterium sp. cf332]|uniref:alpha/beta hydrolase n=1 Tax=Microbacterium sp. cf332 TaxID=1761804 RepID=UPI00087F919A|nr:alpha/beta hydrolase [Microbacterium sp. cf332]SDQ76750.1 Alpha/beta hydrolase [Microbacterium sp. cf332]
MTLTSPNRGYPLERLEGNAGSMSWWSSAFGRVAGSLGELRTATQAATELPGVGAAIIAARADAQEVVGAIAGEIAEAELLAGVMQRYADAFATSAEQANSLIDDVESAHAVWQSAAGQAEQAGLAALWTSRSGEADEVRQANDDARDAVAARDAAQRDLAELWAQYEALYTSWDEAYDAALAELAAGAGSTLTSESRSLLDQLLAADSPAEVLALWLAHPELHSEIEAAHPDIIGNLDGIPYDVRARVNAERLAQLYEADLPGELGDQIDALWNTLAHGPPPPQLISFDPDGSDQVTAAFAYGDLGTATDINVLVPGMNSNVAGMGEWGETARALNSAGPGLATVVWFGYDSPSEIEEPSMDRAHDGAAALRSFLLGIDAVHPAAETAVIAHSYGSTTAALAIGSQPDALGVDQFIAVGSAGFPSDPQVLSNLQNAEGLQMYATLSENDAWARIGRDTSWGGAHGTVPETLPGVTEFGSDGGYAADGQHLTPTGGHSAHGGGNGPLPSADGDGYLVEGSESLYNIGQIVVTGEPGTEMDGAGSERGFWDLPDWLRWLPVDPYRT